MIVLTNYAEETFNFTSRAKAIAWLSNLSGQQVELAMYNLVWIGKTRVWGTWKRA
jgi:hypothetical protein